MTRRRRRALIVVLLTLIGLGVPLALLHWVGNPLPAGVPSRHEIARAFADGEVSHGSLVKALALVCWVAWIELLVALAVEAWARRAGRPARRLPMIGVMQGAAAVLVASLGGFGDGSDPALDGPPPLARLLQMTDAAGPHAEPAAGATGPDVVDGSPLLAGETPADWLTRTEVGTEADGTEGGTVRSGPSHTVAARETLWSIATERLGDARRWREVFELNEGRPQADGSPLDRPERHLVAGTVLDLPGDATPVERAPAAAPRVPSATPSERGDVAPAEVAEILTLDAPPIRAGSLLDGLSRAGLLAGGVIWSVDRLRRGVERRRMAGDAPALAGDGARRVEASLREAGRVPLLERTDRVVTAWGSALAAAGRMPPPLIGVNVAEELSLLFGEADVDPLPGYAVEDDGLSWVTSLTGDALPEVNGPVRPYPCLVTIGHTDRSQVLVNLEGLGVVAVVGREWDVEECVFGWATELATGPAAHAVTVAVVGDGRAFERLPGVSVHRSLDAIERSLEALVAGIPADLAKASVGSVAEARGRGDRSMAPATVVIAVEAAPAEVERLMALAERAPGGPLAVVIGGDAVAAPWRVEVRERDITLQPVNVVLERPRIPERARTAIRELLDPQPAMAVPVKALRPIATVDATAEPPLVEVQVLGPVRVEGAAGPFPRRKALEFVAYLALHRRGADADMVAEALWPDRLVSPRTLHGTASHARRALGVDGDGEPLLPRAGADGLYTVDPRVGVDVERFASLVARAGQSPDEARAHLEAALHLVRGRPFAVPGGEFLWVHAEALMTAIVAEVADAAHWLASLCLDARDARGAWWATQQGLLASPGNEQLHRDRMLAADLAGNPAGVDEVLHELCRSAEVSRREMASVLHPLTVELYERLSRRGAGRQVATVRRSP